MRIILLCSAILLAVAFGVNAYAETGEDYTRGEIKWSRLNYKITNSTATATVIVNDSDMNKIPSHIDTLPVHVFSDTYPEGIILELYETRKNSGQFERSFTISEERFAPSILYMKEGDTLSAKYVDYTLPLSSETDSLEMTATTLAGHSAPPLERVLAKFFELQDFEGQKLHGTVKFGQQIELTSSLANQYNKTQNFVYLVQILNQHEQTVSLSWIKGAMHPYQTLNTSQSWIPTKSGSYHAVAFVWESLTNPSALSPPVSLDFEVAFEDTEDSVESVSQCKGEGLCLTEKITRIIDGDTLYLGDYKIRLSLTNTPERHEIGFHDASKFTAETCPVGTVALVDQDDLQPYDVYDRVLGKVVCGNKVLNSELLYAGHANILTRYCPTSEFSEEAWAQEFGC